MARKFKAEIILRPTIIEVENIMAEDEDEAYNLAMEKAEEESGPEIWDVRDIFAKDMKEDRVSKIILK